MQHALSEADLNSADTMRGLAAPCQSLLLRLLLRKGPWFRVDSLCYEDVEDVDAAVRALRSVGFVKVLAVDAGNTPHGAVLSFDVCHFTLFCGCLASL
jgi:hypothetical protein